MAVRHPNANDPSTTTYANTPGDGHRFTWHRCPEHADLVLSVIDVEGCQPWCVGDGDTRAGHWVELESAA